MQIEDAVLFRAKIKGIGADFPGEVASLICAGAIEAADEIGKLIDISGSFNSDGNTAEIGLALREITGLDAVSSKAINLLSGKEESLFDEVIEILVRRNYPTG